MAAFNKFNAFVADVNNKVHNMGADNIKVMLSDVAPVATNAVKADITEITAQNGYSAGGSQATLISSTQTGGLYKLLLNSVTFTAAGGSFGPFRYAIFYNSTPASGNLIGWYDYGAEVTVTNGNSFQVNPDAVNGLYTDQ